MATPYVRPGIEVLNEVTAPVAHRPADQLAAELRSIVGAASVILDPAQRAFYSTDIAKRGASAALVVQVADTAQLSAAVRACTQAGYIVIPRGGGFSYTGGYTPEADNTVMIDMRAMDRIAEINLQDMYVVVETGCTWARLYEALKPQGVRTPYWGPMSGYHATIGGALSQGSFFLGSTQYGTVSDSVLGLEVVVADGTVVRTGSGASTEGIPPFMRQYGPDGTGLFLSDCGAMGLKARVVLRLIKTSPYQAYGSFAFTSHASALAAVSDIGRSGLASECYCWDPFFVRLMAAASTGTRQDLRFLLNVVKAGSGLIDGLSAAARMAFAGRRDMRGDGWLLHITVDDASAAGAAARRRILRRLAKAQGGREVAPSAPRTMRGTPFIAFNVPERQGLRRSLPVHGIAAHSRAPAVADDVYEFLNLHQPAMQAVGIECGVIFFAVLGQAAAIEPLLYWDDPEHRLHDRIAQTSDLDQLASYPERPPATRLAFELADGLKAIFRRHGCAHLQIGRAYPWHETLDPATLRLIKAAKHAVDPKVLINRGALGLGGLPPGQMLQSMRQ